MLTNDHPQDSLPAFVLGTLDVDEALLVNAHVMRCSACRAEVESFQEVLIGLPYVATPREPPAHVKQQLLARIAATAQPASPRPRVAAPRWMQLVTGAALALSLAFGAMLYDTNSRLGAIGGTLAESQRSIAAMTNQLEQNQQALVRLDGQRAEVQKNLDDMSRQYQQAQATLADMQAQLAQDRQITVFISAPQTVHRVLDGADQRAHATMYMQPNNRQAVLVVEGMPHAEPGKVYQFWLAKPGVQVPSETFNVSDDGLAVVRITAPTPVNQYDQVMVTVEQANGASLPSDQVVLSGSLATALPPDRSRAD
ncbi:MAG TPA: anti-sigma factor [Roseiflexaceae bacterium]|nr:anti-sigma factor [Roseiflexaceae bacterium]